MSSTAVCILPWPKSRRQFPQSPDRIGPWERFSWATAIGLTLWLCLCFVALAQEDPWKVVGHMGTPPGYLHSVEFTDSLHGWIGGYGGDVFYTTDGGATWTGAKTQRWWQVEAISMRDSLSGWCCASTHWDAAIFHTTDGGRTWPAYYQTPREVSLGGGEYFWGIDYAGSNTIVACGQPGVSGYGKVDSVLIVRSTDGGRSWKRTTWDIRTVAWEVQFLDSLNGFVSGPYGLLLRTTDAGASWQKLPGPYNTWAYHFFDTRLGWTAWHGVYCRTDDSGWTWQTMQIDDPAIDNGYYYDGTAPYRISFVDSLYGWDFGLTWYQGINTSGITRTTDGGRHWQVESRGLTPMDTYLEDGVMINRRWGYSVGNDGSVLAYYPPPDTAKPPTVPTVFLLEQNYPNPFNGTTTIRYELPGPTAEVRLEVFDLLGQRVKVLVSLPEQAAGVYPVSFQSEGLASGVYFYRLQAGSFVDTKKLLLIR